MTDDKFAQAKSIDILNTRGLSAKRDYVRGLERRGDAEALSLLVECLCDESWFLRDLAEEAFLNMAERGAPVLLPLLEQGLWFTRTSAARILGRLGYRPAVSPLLILSDDSNATVAAAARDALAAIGHQRGAVSLAHALHRASPEIRRRRLDELASRDRALYERLERMMRNEELMNVEDGQVLSDDHELVRSSEEGVEWELLTGPPPEADRPGPGGGGNAERST
ncbi:MAG TPA: HEAT repeat domain-containing protein [Candidatus Udaeobacter sp.]|nr:HEAT repeat domain-containing protein [Candidatus Udaeobacter sp.]